MYHWHNFSFLSPVRHGALPGLVASCMLYVHAQSVSCIQVPRTEQVIPEPSSGQAQTCHADLAPDSQVCSGSCVDVCVCIHTLFCDVCVCMHTLFCDVCVCIHTSFCAVLYCHLYVELVQDTQTFLRKNLMTQVTVYMCLMYNELTC